LFLLKGFVFMLRLCVELIQGYLNTRKSLNLVGY
jgi:hypothetical protein